MDIRVENLIDDEEYVKVDTIETDHSVINIFFRRCNTQEEVDAIQERVWRGLAKVSVDHWKRTGELL